MFSVYYESVAHFFDADFKAYEAWFENPKLKPIEILRQAKMLNVISPTIPSLTHFKKNTSESNWDFLWIPKAEIQQVNWLNSQSMSTFLYQNSLAGKLNPIRYNTTSWMNNRTVEGKVILKDTSLLQAAFTYKSSEESYPLSTWYGGDSVEVDEFGNVYSVYPEPVKIQFSDVEIESFLV